MSHVDHEGAHEGDARAQAAGPEEGSRPAGTPGSGTSSIERALASADAEDRRQATAELGRLTAAEALPLLLGSLGDEDWRVRKEATLVARSFGGAAPLLESLVSVFAGGDNVGLRNAAVEVLASAGHAATAALAAALPRLDADGRKLAVETLGRGRDPAALGALEAALGDADDNVRESAVEAIAALGPLSRDRVAELLLARLDDRDRLVRLTALEGLAALEVTIPWSRLAPLLDEPTLRTAALAAAAQAESPDAARALTAALARARGSAFDQALRALGRLAEGPLAPSVAEALRGGAGEQRVELGQRLVAAARAEEGGDDPLARRAVALRLAVLAGAPGLVDAAVLALTEDLLAETAQQALTALGAPALPAVFARLADASTPPETRAALVDVIADVLGEGAGSAAVSGALPGALAALRGAARDAERHVAMRALRALSRLGEARDLELAAEQTLDPARPVAVAAEGALAALAARFPEAGRAFVDRVAAGSRAPAASDEAHLLPAAIVIGALASQAGGAGARASSPSFSERHAVFLAHAATAGDTGARRAAVEAVSALRAAVGAGYPAALEVLSFALTDEEHEVQMAAARALGRLCSAPDAPRASDVLDLVDRGGAADLVAATVRAMGEGLRPGPDGGPGAAPSAELISALTPLAHRAPSPVAVAAVDSLARAHRAGAPGALQALAGALDHPDEDVVKAALLKLASAGSPGAPVTSGGAPAGVVLAGLARALAHPSAAVRALAAESLGELPGEGARAELTRRLPLEQDHRVEEAIQSALAMLGPDGGPGGGS